MPVPDRSMLPSEFVAYIEKQNAELADHTPLKPILPAPSTPQELVDAAQKLDQLIETHRNDGSLAAELIDNQFRHLIDAVLARTVTEPVQQTWQPVKWGDTDLYEPKRKDLERAWGDLVDLATGYDKSSPAAMKMARRMALKVRQKVAKQMGVELDLTDQEWWQL